MSLRLFVLRHGETVFTRDRRFAGWRDVPLTDAGLRQSEAAAAALSGVAISTDFESPLERARTSAEAVAKPHRLAVQIMPVFRELGFGAWEGRTGAGSAPRACGPSTPRRPASRSSSIATTGSPCTE